MLYVRGCHSELTGVTEIQRMSLQNNEFCEARNTYRSKIKTETRKQFQNGFFGQESRN